MSFSKEFLIALSVREAINDWFCDGHNPNICAETLAGACAIGSLALNLVYRRHRIRSTFVCGVNYKQGNGHCWVELGNKIYDITASQFGYVGKVLIENKNYYKNDYKTILRGHKAIRETRHWQDQSPHEYLEDIRELVSNI